MQLPNQSINSFQNQISLWFISVPSISLSRWTTPSHGGRGCLNVRPALSHWVDGTLMSLPQRGTTEINTGPISVLSFLRAVRLHLRPFHCLSTDRQQVPPAVHCLHLRGLPVRPSEETWEEDKGSRWGDKCAVMVRFAAGFYCSECHLLGACAQRPRETDERARVISHLTLGMTHQLPLILYRYGLPSCQHFMGGHLETEGALSTLVRAWKAD